MVPLEKDPVAQFPCLGDGSRRDLALPISELWFMPHPTPSLLSSLLSNNPQEPTGALAEVILLQSYTQLSHNKQTQRLMEVR